MRTVSLSGGFVVYLKYVTVHIVTENIFLDSLKPILLLILLCNYIRTQIYFDLMMPMIYEAHSNKRSPKL